MYVFLNKNDYKDIKSYSSNVINELVQEINKEKKLFVSMELIGSGAKNLILQNGDNPIDFDYNIIIEEFIEYTVNKCAEIKNYIIEKFNIVLKRKKLSGYRDSKSVITTKKISKYNKVFSIDVAVVAKFEGIYNKIIHQKTGDTKKDEWYWNQIKDSNELEKKVEKIKSKNWEKLRQTYKNRKNMYLERNDHDHSSFICYVEAINEVFSSLNLK